MNVYDEIIKVIDASFSKKDLDDHYKRHTDGGGKTQLPKGMTKEQYGKKAESVSLSSISPLTQKNRKVRAYKRDASVTCKTDGSWFVSYSGGKNGKVNTLFPANTSYFERRMKEEGGQEIFFES